jgi:importin subunit beta-1
MMVLDQMAVTLANANSIVGDDDRRNHYQQQANICGLYTSIVHYDSTHVRANADPIMQTLLSIISGAHKDSTVKEEAFVAIGAVAGAVEGHFIRYMEPLMPFIFSSLQNHEDYTVCAIVLGVLGDICRALGETIFPYAQALIQNMAQLLSLPEVHRKVKPASLSAIGDLSLAIGGQFEVFVHPTMELIAVLSNQLASIPQVMNLPNQDNSRTV